MAGAERRGEWRRSTGGSQVCRVPPLQSFRLGDHRSPSLKAFETRSDCTDPPETLPDVLAWLVLPAFEPYALREISVHKIDRFSKTLAKAKSYSMAKQAHCLELSASS